jgi:hypothetical protein
MEFFAAAAFWAMIVCAVVSIIGLLVRWWRRSAATIETWRRLAARPDWRMPLNDDLTVDVLSVGNAALITVQGSLTIQSAQAVSNCIRRLASEGKDHIVLDLSAAHFRDWRHLRESWPRRQRFTIMAARWALLLRERMAPFTRH